MKMKSHGVSKSSLGSHGPSKSKMASAAPREYNTSGMMSAAPRAKPGGLNPGVSYSKKGGPEVGAFTARGGTGMNMSKSSKINPLTHTAPKNINKPSPQEPKRKVVE